MFGLFKKNKRNKSNVQFVDLSGNELKVGDFVMSHRYELGKCMVGQDDNGFFYESLETKKKISWALMVDAVTERQKVDKIFEE